MITIRPSIFCFLGRVAPDLQVAVPAAVRKRLGVVPEVFAFLSVTQETIDLKLGARRPKLPPFEGSVQNRLWQTLTFASAAIGNIRIRTDALRRPAESDQPYQVARGGPDIHIVECLSDELGWDLAFSLAEKIHARNETPPSTGRARGIFPLFHLPSIDEDLEREQALAGLKRLEGLVRRGVLFPSIVLDRVNRSGYPMERWEDLTELLADFLSLGAASEAAADIWRTFPQVADLCSSGSSGEGSFGISSIGLSRFRFNKDTIAGELARLYQKDLKRALGRTYDREPAHPDREDSRSFLDDLVDERSSEQPEGERFIQQRICSWIKEHGEKEMAGALQLGVWAVALDRLQLSLFERLGEAAQRIENIRQENEALQLETPLRDTWIARVSVLLPVYTAFLGPVLGGALLGSFLGFIFSGSIRLAGYFSGAAVGAIVGLLLGWLIRLRWSRETFTLGEFPQSSFTAGFPVPRSLEQFHRKQKQRNISSGLSIQLWGELRNQVEPQEKERLDSLQSRLAADLDAARREERELVFLDRCVNGLREAVEVWRTRLQEVEIWEPARGFSGDIFPAEGPRKIYEHFEGRLQAEKSVEAVLSRISPLAGEPSPPELSKELAEVWGKEKAEELSLDKVLEILEDEPKDLLERMSEASAPLWPRPGDVDELLRCFGTDFAQFAKENDLRHTLKDETVFLRVLGGVRSAEVERP